MDIVDCIEGRTSIRVFRHDPVPDELIDEAVRLANLAPSAGNLQARDFIIVKDVAVKRALMEASHRQDFIRTAPTVIVGCANLERIGHYGERGRSLYCIQDVAAAVENIMLFLFSKGIGTVWVGAFDEESAREALGLPSHVRPVVMLPIGYPAEEGVRRRRLPQQEIVHRDKW